MCSWSSNDMTWFSVHVLIYQVVFYFRHLQWYFLGSAIGILSIKLANVWSSLLIIRHFVQLYFSGRSNCYVFSIIRKLLKEAREWPFFHADILNTLRVILFLNLEIQIFLSDFVCILLFLWWLVLTQSYSTSSQFDSQMVNW